MDLVIPPWAKTWTLGGLTALAAAFAPACGAESGGADTDQEGAVGCVPGESRPCPCPDGTTSFQACNATGTGLEPCACGGGAMPTGGAPATGGVTSTGGVTYAGGATSTGGVTYTGGAGGVLTTGGTGAGGFGGMAAGGVGAAGAPFGGAGGVGVGGAPVGGSGGAPPVTGPAIPAPASSCPQFVDGPMTFSVAGVQRSMTVWVDLGATATLDGPVVFYWYGTGGQPSQATSGLGTDGIGRITAAGGIVVAPSHINSGTFPWIGGDGSDYLLMDEVVACAEQQIGIDETHIHALGFSAGGLFTTQLSFARSAYIASVATYSGGGGGVSQDPSNLFPAMILFGGAGDQLVANFADTSRQYYDALKGAGHYALLCDHGGGHSIPTGARSSVVQFFFDHGFKQPSAYVGGFPPGFVSYCIP